MRLDDMFDVGAQDGPELVHDRVLTVPNLLSLIRLLTLPLVVLDVLGDRPVRALVVLALIASTDWVDGYVARRFDQVSRLGRLLDPISDRVLIITVAVTLVVAEIVPLWAMLAVLARDLAVAGVGLAMLSRGTAVPTVTRIGKAATFALMTAFPLLLVAEALDAGGRTALRGVAFVVLAVGTVLYWMAAGQYAMAVRHRDLDVDG